MAVLEIAENDYDALRFAIRERFGVHYGAGKKFLLQSRLQPRLRQRGFDGFASYVRFLANHPQREEEWDELASLLCNNETYFFRETSQLEVLSGEVLDGALACDAPLRVWSAACSSGEEPLTLAMVLLESRRIAPGRIEILASDLSPRALARCESGCYPALSFRATPPEIVAKYFKPFEGGGFAIASSVKRLVSFFRLNLVDEKAVAGVGLLDAIFCRNVLIYFDRATQRRVVQAFARALRPGGYLFLGHAESAAQLRHLYEPVITPRAIYYRLQGVPAKR